MQGFNVRLKVNSKAIVAVTQDELNIDAQTKESYTKDDAGVKRTKVTGHDITFTVSALYEEVGSGSITALYRDDIIALALKEGDNASVPFEYGPSSGTIYTGKAIITGYKETTPADPTQDSTISLTLKVDGAMTLKSSS